MRLCAHGLCAVVACLLIAACSDDSKTPIDSHIDSDSGASDAAAVDADLSTCSGYCQWIASHGTGCTGYNAAGRCESICQFYLASPCVTQYNAFRDCVTTTSVECTPSSGKLALTTQGCGDAYNTWNTCLEEKDAGYCPY